MVTISKFFTKTVIQGARPSNPGNVTTDIPPVVNPPSSGGVNLFTKLSDVSDSNYIGKNGFVPVVVDESNLELQPLPQFEEYRLISGGVVQWTGTGYVFNVSSAIYKIGGVLYQTVPSQVTLATPDPTDNRIDVLAVDVNNAVVIIAGTPSGTPVKPQIDPSIQLELTSILVIAASTIPTLTEQGMYEQNTEWTGSTTGTGTVAFNSAVDPYQGSLSIETTTISNGLKVRLTDGADYDISTVQTIGFQIKLKAVLFSGQNIGMTLLNSSGSPVSNQLILNLNKSDLAYQFVGIALNTITFTNNLIRSVEFEFIRTKGSSTHLGYFLDIIKLEGGINPPVTVGSFLNLSDTPNSYSGQGGKTVAVKADASGLEFVAGGGGGASTFIGLTDTPTNYTGSANKFPRVNGTPDALIFDTISPYDLDQEGATDGQVLSWSAANSRFEPTTGGGGGLWTDATTFIYRNSPVSIGQITISANTTFQIKSVPAVSTQSIFSILKNSGQSALNLIENGSINITTTNISLGGSPFSSVGDGLKYRASSTSSGLEAFLIEDVTGASMFRVLGDKTVTMFGSRILMGNPSTFTNHGLTLKSSDNSNSNFALEIQNSSSTQIMLLRASGIFLLPTARHAFGTVSANVVNGCYFKGSSTYLSIFEIANSSDVVQFRVFGNGGIQYFDGGNFQLGTISGTKIGTAITQKIGFWNATPIIQPTTAVAASTLVAGGGASVTDTDTFDGYTLAKVVKALRNTGLLA